MIKHVTVFAFSLYAFAAPLSAFAHEHQTFRIGDTTVSFTVGSLNEPVAIDDKSGVELMASFVSDEAGTDHSHEAALPVEGLEKTLKVEVSAAGTKKEFALTTQYGKPGSYKAVFFPTVQTTLTYRFFGTINSVPVDLSFTCNPAGHPQTEPDTSAVTISEGVTRLEKSGAFGCPVAKADLGFPEPSSTLHDLATKKEEAPAMPMDRIAFILSLAGIGIACVALFKAKRGPVA